MATRKQIAANRSNSNKSSGPTNTTRTRFNATKHGLYSEGPTELDIIEGYPAILADLMRQKEPVGVLDTHRVECMARDIVRQKRAQRWEGKFVSLLLSPAQCESMQESDTPIFSTVIMEVVEKLTSLQRCESFYANDLIRNDRELECSQRMRQGEHLPAPASIELTLHTDPGSVNATSVASKRTPPTKVIEALPSTLKSGRADDPSEPAQPGSEAVDPPPDDPSEPVRPGPQSVDSPSKTPESGPDNDRRHSEPRALWHKGTPKALWNP